MKILWLTWKDLKHPLAGGAEVVNEALAKRLAADGHEVRMLVAGFPGAAQSEERDGYRIIREGGRYTSYLAAWRHYRRHLRGWADLVIDECNTMPYFAKFYVREPSVMFVHMLCRKIWFYEFPWPLSLIGYAAEPLYLRLLRGQRAITVSESTKQDLMRVGFHPDRIHIISEGIELIPLPILPEPVEGHTPSPPSAVSSPLGPESSSPGTDSSSPGLTGGSPTILSLGSIRPMKRTADQITAFELAKRSIPNLKMVIAGDSSSKYGQKIVRMLKDSPYAADILYKGWVTSKQRLGLMRQAHAILVTSVKEGWGLIVTEAASQGTPAVVYNVDGLRDSVRHGETGFVCDQAPKAMAAAIAELLQDPSRYDRMRHAAWQWSHDINFDRSYAQIRLILEDHSNS